ncbi:MAG: thymidine phosphorylase, partial [Oscillospiraceae bacterium]
MRMYDIIHKKREGGALSPEELAFFVGGYVSGKIPDYQASAFLMAVYFQGMTPAETAELTGLMAKSGDMVDLSSIH